ncbi:MAG: oligosaccharide flippase family protein [Candidatus Zixiibacteriota bacterium]
MVLYVQLLKNIFSSWAGFAIRIIITFFFVPLITGILGDARYGVWVIVFQTINYLSLLDIGLEKALVRYLSKHLSREDYPQINRILNTSAFIYLIIGTVIIISAGIIAHFFFGSFKIDDPSLAAEGRTALTIIGIYLGCRFYLFPFGGTLGAFQRYDLANFLNISEDIIKTLVMVWLLLHGYGLVALAIVIFSVSLVRMLSGTIWLKKLYPEIKFRLALADRATAGTLFSYSKISFAITACWIVIFSTDSLLLGLMASSAAAGIYAPGAQLMLYLRHIVNAVGIPLIPAVSQLESNGNFDRIRDIYLRGLKYISYFSFFLTVGVIMYARGFVGLWLKPEFAEAARVMVILGVSSAFFLPQIVGNSILFGIEKHKYLLYALICEASIKIILSLMLIERYGIIGMALAAAVPQFLIYITIYPFFMSRVLKLSLTRIMLFSLGPGLAALIVAVPVTLLVRHFLPPVSWPVFFLNIVLVTAIVALPAWFLLDKEDRELICGFFGQKG